MKTLALAAVLGLSTVLLACSAVDPRRENPDQPTGAGGATSGAQGSGGSVLGAGGGDPSTHSDACGNGLDDDGDGLVDQGCACEGGAWQPCWTGAAARRNVGVCRDGVQKCEAFGEFLAWGACEGQVTPGTEVQANAIDEDCDGTDWSGDSCTGAETCGNAADDDCDGLVDCADPDCASSCASCAPSETECGNGADDDCDGYADCVDPDCTGAVGCGTSMGCTPEFPFFVEIACGDGNDNDCDSKIDCDDDDCQTPGACGCDQTEQECSTDGDSDCDDAIGCDDIDCQRCTEGTFRWCDTPVACTWGKQYCAPDGHWGSCDEVIDAPPGCGDGSTIYSTECCLQAGECCQDFPNQGSVGNCDGIVTCE